MIGAFLHYLMVLGIIKYAVHRKRIHDFVDDASGMVAEHVQKADLKGKAKRSLEKYVEKKTQERGGIA